MDSVRARGKGSLPCSCYRERPVGVTRAPLHPNRPHVLVQPGHRQRLRGHREVHRVAVIHPRRHRYQQRPGTRSRRYRRADRYRAPAVDRHPYPIQQYRTATLGASETSSRYHHLTTDHPRGRRYPGDHRRRRSPRTHRHAIERRRRQRGRRPIAHRQSHVHALRHAHRLARPQLHPVHSITRPVHTEHTAASRQLQPIRQCRASHRLVGTGGSRAGPLAHENGRGIIEQIHVAGTRVQRLPHHDSRLRRAAPLQAQHPGHDRSVP